MLSIANESGERFVTHATWRTRVRIHGQFQVSFTERDILYTQCEVVVAMTRDEVSLEVP